MKYTILSLLSFTAVSLVQGQVTVATWNPTADATDIVTSRTALPNTLDRQLSFASLTSPTVGADYYPNHTGATPEFYGAAFGQADSGSGFVNTLNNFDVDNNSGGDYIRARVDGGVDSINAECHLISVWTKEYFINGGSSSPAALTSLSAQLYDNAGDPNVRFVVQLSDSNFYASEVIADRTVASSDLPSLGWFDYDPTTDFTVVGSAASLNAASFDDVQAVGVYLNSIGDTRYSLVGIESFTAEASVIPEPGAMALMFGSVALLGAWARRKRR